MLTCFQTLPIAPAAGPAEHGRRGLRAAPRFIFPCLVLGFPRHMASSFREEACEPPASFATSQFLCPQPLGACSPTPITSFSSAKGRNVSSPGENKHCIHCRCRLKAAWQPVGRKGQQQEPHKTGQLSVPSSSPSLLSRKRPQAEWLVSSSSPPCPPLKPCDLCFPFLFCKMGTETESIHGDVVRAGELCLAQKACWLRLY